MTTSQTLFVPLHKLAARDSASGNGQRNVAQIQPDQAQARIAALQFEAEISSPAAELDQPSRLCCVPQLEQAVDQLTTIGLCRIEGATRFITGPVLVPVVCVGGVSLGVHSAIVFMPALGRVGCGPSQRLSLQAAKVFSPNLCEKQLISLGKKPARTSSGQSSRTS